MVSVIAAGVASYAFGALWYSLWANRWVAAAEINPDEIDSKNPMPFIISAICTLIVAGMMRHIFVMAGISGAGAGMIGGFGLGAFIAMPWIATNYAFGGRKGALTLIDGGYATIGSTIMGLVLGYFAAG